MARTPPRLEYSSRQHDAILKPKLLFSKCQWFKIENLILHWLLDRYYHGPPHSNCPEGPFWFVWRLFRRLVEQGALGCGDAISAGGGGSDEIVFRNWFGTWFVDTWQLAKFADPLPETQNERSASFCSVFATIIPAQFLSTFDPLHVLCFLGHKSIVMVRSWNLLRSKMLKFKTWTVWCTQQLFCGSVFIPQSHPFRNHRLEIRWSFEINPTSVSRIVEIWVGFDVVVNHIWKLPFQLIILFPNTRKITKPDIRGVVGCYLYPTKPLSQQICKHQTWQIIECLRHTARTYTLWNHWRIHNHAEELKCIQDSEQNHGHWEHPIKIVHWNLKERKQRHDCSSYYNRKFMYTLVQPGSKPEKRHLGETRAHQHCEKQPHFVPALWL